MKTYLVGGAIRDSLLGLNVKERDWVVVGATPEILIEQGYKPVGKDFPVFLHPTTHEEYALARTERKVARGYKGFSFYYSTDVTLEQDLKRRDLTINAIAQADDGELFDPYNGQKDLQDKCFRHVSSAFAEDPVRILRVARFAAKLPEFKVHHDTNTLMQSMVANGEVNALVAERVWQEFRRALSETSPSRFFDVLTACGALATLWPEINEKGLNCLEKATKCSDNATIRFAALTHNIPLKELQALCRRLHIPNEYSQIAMLVSNNIAHYANLDLKSSSAVLAFLKGIDCLRRSERLKIFCEVFAICHPGDHPIKNQYVRSALSVIKAIDTASMAEQGLKGQDFARALETKQLAAIESLA